MVKQRVYRTESSFSELAPVHNLLHISVLIFFLQWFWDRTFPFRKILWVLWQSIIDNADLGTAPLLSLWVLRERSLDGGLWAAGDQKAQCVIKLRPFCQPLMPRKENLGNVSLSGREMAGRLAMSQAFAPTLLTGHTSWLVGMSLGIGLISCPCRRPLVKWFSGDMGFVEGAFTIRLNNVYKK